MCAGRQGTSPAVLLATRRRVFLVTMPDGEARISSASLRQVLAIEEDRQGSSTTVTLLTARSTIVVTGVPTARAWMFCRTVRASILASG